MEISDLIKKHSLSAIEKVKRINLTPISILV